MIQLKNYQCHSFTEMNNISPCKMFMAAGQFAKIADERAKKNKVDYHIYVRQSKLTFVHASELFEIAQCGTRYYEQLTKTSFPYEKHDLMFLPQLSVSTI